MAFYLPIKWITSYLPWTPVIYLTYDAFSPSLLRTSSGLVVALVPVLSTLATKWQDQVTKYVPGPYMDEVFHIPQAQAYCAGDFHIWDPKLTTPPGLYIFTSYFCNLRLIRTCSVLTLRHFNSLVLVFLFAYAGSCRAQITRLGSRGIGTGSGMGNGIHTAFNIVLFPPLFFFGGLFYTDVLSTAVVLRMYRLWLDGGGGIWLYLAGVLTLTMRQTNIFWAAVFLGGLEAVRTLKSIKSIPGNNEKDRSCWQGKVSAAFHQYTRGEIHEIPLKDAEIYDFALTAISIAVAILSFPLLILKRLYPYVALLLSFAAFVFWNGGVVLGDKSAHVATIHLPQLLYLWAFIAFFSFPLLIPSFISLLKLPFSIKRPTPLRILLTGATMCIESLVVLGLIHFNTLIHPYTLADNRHYMFYVFRYTILRHPAIKYLLAPIYMFAFYLCKLTLAGTSSSLRTPAPINKPSPGDHAKKAAGENMLFEIKRETEGEVSTSYFLIWIFATALSLITAPLVEPRYFILPWLFWRLHVPSLQASSSSSSAHSSTQSALRKAAARRSASKTRGLLGMVKDWGYREHDARLWLETLWFLAINAATGYIFLHRGYAWESEPGRVQRFMW